MAKPRNNPHRELYGFLGSSRAEAREVLRSWNRRCQSEGIDASMDFYPTTALNLPERLSEMFHFDRRGYVVAVSLSKAIMPLLDRVEAAAKGRGVKFVHNENGVLRGEASSCHAERRRSMTCTGNRPSSLDYARDDKPLRFLEVPRMKKSPRRG